MSARPRTPILSPLGILLVALSLSIGWGIRGNYGHETGAMFPGALAAIAVALLSGRDDWQRRVPFFAFFGALGWAFGGSISYMQVIGFTHSGQRESQVYGFACLYVIGFLWGGLGGAGTALPAVLDRRRLTDLFLPVIVALLALLIADELVPRLDAILRTEGAMQRHDSPLYWFDSDYLQACVVVVAMLLFDLVERRGAKLGELVVLAALGALLGAAVQWLLHAVGWDESLGNLLVRSQGDTSIFPREKLVTNWPNFLPQVAAHVGWGVGLAAGVAIYFVRHGRFARGSSLILFMALGWLAGFILFPVLLDLRMTPPRGDDWAGILGVLAGALAWCWRERLAPVAVATLISGAIGGLGFSGIACLKLLMTAPGNPAITRDATVVETWKHWQSANWHSFLEQSYGFVNGIGIAIALGLLATRLAPRDDGPPRRRWTEMLSVVFVVPWLLHVNMIKNVNDWTAEHGGFRSLPQKMQAPLFDSINLSASAWFNVFYAIAAAAFVVLLWAHARRPLAIVPSTWLGRGQLLFFVILWSFVLGNFAKALTSFADARLLTEGTIIVNAVIVTVLILVLPRDDHAESGATNVDFHRLVVASAVLSVLAVVLATPLETFSVRALYGDKHAGHSQPNFRFGANANWKARPLLKGTPHR